MRDTDSTTGSASRNDDSMCSAWAKVGELDANVKRVGIRPDAHEINRMVVSEDVLLVLLCEKDYNAGSVLRRTD
ncbi:hypothetical protein ACKVEX_08175 [Rhodocyclaceae bacterium SMB388]